MPMYDRKCDACGREEIDVLEPVNFDRPACGVTTTVLQIPITCGGRMQRAWLTKPANVIGDDIPGGVMIEHAICNPDGTPKRYDSKSAIARAAKEKGYTNYVQHIGQHGTDKSKHTTRWV